MQSDNMLNFSNKPLCNLDGDLDSDLVKSKVKTAMEKYEPYEGYKCEVDLDRIEADYVLPLNDRTIRAIALANIEGRKAYVELDKRLAIIMPYIEGLVSVIDQNGHIKKIMHRLTKSQKQVHSDIHEYMANKLWFEHGQTTCEPDDAEDYDTQISIVSCMENFLICLDPQDERKKIFEDILCSNPEPAQELIYNLHRLDMMHLWQRHYLVWKIAEIKEQLRFYESLIDEMSDLTDDSDTPKASDDLPF